MKRLTSKLFAATSLGLTLGAAACAGQMRLKAEGPFFSAEVEYNASPPAPEMQLVKITGPAVDKVRGESFVIEFLDKNGQPLGSTEGTIPTAGDWTIVAPSNADSANYATGADATGGQDAPAGPQVALPRLGERRLELFQTVWIDLGLDTSARGYAMDVWAQDLVDALQAGRSVAETVLRREKPNIAQFIHYWYSIEEVPGGMGISTAQWSDPIDQFSLSVNQFYADENQAVLSAVAGWSGASVVVPLSELFLPAVPGATVVNDMALDVDQVSLVQHITTTL